MNKKQKPLHFPITVYNVEPINDTLSRGRLRIFYRKANRNGSYITDEFAEQLLQTLPYTPIKGIFNEDKEDFEGHGKASHLGRIYGVVPENPNRKWEAYEDSDGIIRTYATADVILYTALYEEAGEIIGKSQSMELYPPSIEGEWIDVNGQLLYKYTKASFLGLQVLGDDVKPAFQGAGFFSAETMDGYELLLKLFNKFEELSIGRNKQMPNIYNPVFALSDRKKEDKLFQALNPSEIKYWIMEVFEKEIIVYDIDEDKTFKIEYSKNDTEETVVLGEEKVEVFFEYITQSEKDSLTALRTLVAVNSFEEIHGVLVEQNEKLVNAELALNEKEEEKTTLFAEKEEVEGKLEVAENTIGELELEVEKFEALKTKIRDAEIAAIFEKYSEQLKSEIIDSYKEQSSEYSPLELEKELAFELVQSNSLFSSKGKGPEYVPAPTPESGVVSLIKKHN